MTEYDTSEPLITVIIPTLCNLERKDQLLWAIESIKNQGGVKTEIHIIVNGSVFDTKLYDELRSDYELSVFHITEASLPAAIRYGRSTVKTPYFSFLDDDDVYVANTLSKRLSPLLEDNELSFTVVNGEFCRSDSSYLLFENIDELGKDPFTSLMKNNWLASCGGVYRTKDIGLGFFDGKTKYFEWTYLAFLLCLERKKNIFIDIVGFKVHDTEGSISKTDEYVVNYQLFVEMLLQFEVPDNIRRLLNIKHVESLHNTSEYFMFKKENAKSWFYHLRCLMTLHGLRYVPFTRHLLKSSLLLFRDDK